MIYKVDKISTLAAWEIVSVVISCLIAEWVVLAFVGTNKFVLAIPIALYEETTYDLGFRFDNFFASAKLLLAPTALAIALIIFISGFNFSELRWRFLLVPFWALFQQYVLQAFLNRRAQILVGVFLHAREQRLV